MNSRTAWLLSGISAAGLICWIVMFMAGQDVWHDLGAPDIWRNAAVPYPDLRVFTACFYALLVLLVAGTVVPVLMAARGRRSFNSPL